MCKRHCTRGVQLGKRNDRSLAASDWLFCLKRLLTLVLYSIPELEGNLYNKLQYIMNLVFVYSPTPNSYANTIFFMSMSFIGRSMSLSVCQGSMGRDIQGDNSLYMSYAFVFSKNTSIFMSRQYNRRFTCARP